MSQTTEQEARHLIASVNTRNVERVMALYAEDATFQDPSLDAPIRGKKAIRDFFVGYFAAFPDWTMVVTKLVVSGGETYVVHSVRGTHMGPFTGTDGRSVAPTNRKFVQDQLTRVVFDAAGKVQSLRAYGNPADLTRQLGLSN